MSCLYCTGIDTGSMCDACAMSYDRFHKKKDDGTVLASMRWAAHRVLRNVLATPVRLKTLVDLVKQADNLVTFIDTECWYEGQAKDDPKRSVEKYAKARAAWARAWRKKKVEPRKNQSAAVVREA